MNGVAGVDGLRDIRGLDAISMFPLAPGWWLLLLLLIFAVVAVFIMRRYSPFLFSARRDWRRDAGGLLRDLRRRLPAMDGREAAGEFSELMRRIAMAASSRDECAGLSGNDWLDWLNRRDPKGFEWKEYGRVLIEAPYAPPDSRLDVGDLYRLIDAAESWLEKPREQVEVATSMREAA